MVVNKNDSVFKYTYFYNENNQKTVENKYLFHDGVTMPLSRTEWVYENNNCTIQRDQAWVNGGWKNVYDINSAYNNGLKSMEVFETYHNNIPKVEKTNMYNYNSDKLTSIKMYKGSVSEQNLNTNIQNTYNVDNKISQQVFEYKLTDSPDVVISYKYHYNVDGRLDSMMVLKKQDALMVNEFLTTYLYNKSNGNLLVQTQKKWNEVLNKWENLAKNEYEYDVDNKLISEVYSHFTTLFWTVNSKYEYHYDNAGLLNEKILYQPLHREWRKIYTISYQNIENGRPNLMQSKYNFWGGETGQFVKNYIPYYFNNEMSIIQADKLELKYIMETLILTNFELEKNKLKIYPNPSNGVFYVSTENEYINSWSVYDTHGKIVKRNINEYKTGVIDLTELPDGVYLIQANTEDNRMLKQKVLINRKF
ncbi:hypothetical protein MASR2M117_09040 [Paludibacter sp.]